MMKITPPARTYSPQTHLSIPIFGSNHASGCSSIPPFKPFSAGITARYATVRASFAGKIAKYVGKVDTFADVIVSYCRKKGFDDAMQACIVAKEASTMQCKRCIVAKEASTMHCKRCIVANKASTMHCKRCIVENKASTAMLLHRTSRKRKSGRVVTTPPLRTFKNLTNYFFSLNISWQAFQS